MCTGGKYRAHTGIRAHTRGACGWLWSGDGGSSGTLPFLYRTPHTLRLSHTQTHHHHHPSATSLLYQQLHQQVQQRHPEVCFHALEHTPPHIPKVSALNSQLAGRRDLRRWLLGGGGGGVGDEGGGCLLAFSIAESTERRDERVFRTVQIGTGLLAFTHQSAQYPGKAQFSGL